MFDWIRSFRRLVNSASLVATYLVISTASATDTSSVPVLERFTSGHIHGETGRGAVLSTEDQALYREIFALIEQGQIQLAQKSIERLSNDILLGHVQYQIYMHPTAYRSRFSELSRWLNSYADLPGAYRVYRLAKRRQGNARSPRQAVPVVIHGPATSTSEISTTAPVPTYSRTDQRLVDRITGQVKRELRRGKPEAAEKRLWAFKRHDILTEADFDDLLVEVAGGYFYRGEDEKALALASLAADRSRDHFSQADWISGLAAWRLDQCEVAAKHFEHVGRSSLGGDWMQSGGAFWAARAHLKCERPQEVSAWLKISASLGQTFYSQVAARQLGIEPNHSWHIPELSDEDYIGLTALPGVRRAIALYEVGRDELADEELRLIWTRKQYNNRNAIIALGAELGLPATQILLAISAPSDSGLPDSVYYPVPDWQPEDGYKIDRALFLAVMKQESHFLPRARSSVGAMGLMQLMPATASWIARDRSLRWSNKSRLFEPELNISISQSYMLQLMDQEQSGDNMFNFATAYNGGPGNLQRWESRMQYANDPLLFIETIPARETRNFIEKVFANMWIYRSRLDQPTPTLDAIAAGDWPRYKALDTDFPPRLSLASEAERHAGN